MSGHKVTVIRAETMGFCRGVRKAIELVNTILDDGDYPRPIQTLGPLIHNRLVLEEMETRGLRILERPEDARGGTVVIRAHGVAPAVMRKLLDRGLTVVDATCTRVLASERLAARHCAQGRLLVLAGDREHGEIQAIAGCARNVIHVADAKEMAQRLEDPAFADALADAEGVALIGQTTLRPQEYRKISELLLNRCPEAVIANTICPATRQRQDALRRLIEEVDAILVIGGLNSANTRGLYRSVVDAGVPAWHIESAADIPEEIRTCGRIGVTAGASTPDDIIAGVIESLEDTARHIGKLKKGATDAND